MNITYPVWQLSSAASGYETAPSVRYHFLPLYALYSPICCDRRIS